MDDLKGLFKKVAFYSAVALGYVVFSAMDLEFTRRGRVISFEEDPFSFCLIFFLLAIVPLLALVVSSVLYVSSNSGGNSWLNKRLRESAANYHKAKKEAEEYNS